MQHIAGLSRQQLQISSLEDKIALDNLVRFIEAFVEYISLEALGFTVQTIKSEGRRSFGTKLFLKIYLQVYSNGLRSSRNLKRVCSQYRITTAFRRHSFQLPQHILFQKTESCRSKKTIQTLCFFFERCRSDCQKNHRH